jgi:hypothetical protein
MKLILHVELKVPMCGRPFESRVVLCWMYYGPGGCFSMLISMLNNVLGMSRNVVLPQYVGAVYLYGCVCVLAWSVYSSLELFWLSCFKHAQLFTATCCSICLQKYYYYYYYYYWWGGTESLGVLFKSLGIY